MSVRGSTAGPVAPARRHRLDEVLRVGALVRRAAAPTSASVGPNAWIDGRLVRLPGHPPPAPSSPPTLQLYVIDGRLYTWNSDFQWYERYYDEASLPPPPPPMRQPGESDWLPPSYQYTTPPRDSPELPDDEVPPPVPGRTSPARDLVGGNGRGRQLFFSEADDGEDNNNNYNNYNNDNADNEDNNEDNNEDEMNDAMRRMDID